MNINTIPISPITKIQTIVYTQMEINILNLAFGENQCDIQVIVYNDTKEFSKSFVYAITGTSYLEWSSDNYIINFCKTKLSSENF